MVLYLHYNIVIAKSQAFVCLTFHHRLRRFPGEGEHYEVNSMIFPAHKSYYFYIKEMRVSFAHLPSNFLVELALPITRHVEASTMCNVSRTGLEPARHKHHRLKMGCLPKFHHREIKMLALTYPACTYPFATNESMTIAIRLSLSALTYTPPPQQSGVEPSYQLLVMVNQFKKQWLKKHLQA